MSGTLRSSRPSRSLKAGLGLAAAAVRHAGWWLEWNTRRAGKSCRTTVGTSDADVPARERAA